jgi:branched-chain amino acid transport system ATP-binding protein
MALLTIEQLALRFGGLKAVDDVGFSVKPLEIFAIVGPNGAGKTTIFNSSAASTRPHRAR